MSSCKSRKARKNKAIWFLINLGFKSVDGTVENALPYDSYHVNRKHCCQRKGYTFKLDEKWKAYILKNNPEAAEDHDFLSREHFRTWHEISAFVVKYYDKYIV